MSPAPESTDSREQRLNAALADCLEALEQGRSCDAAALGQGYPEFAVELTEFLADREHLGRLTAPLLPPLPPLTPITRGPDDLPATSGGERAPEQEGLTFGDYRLCGEI